MANQANNYRYERKFYITDLTKNEIESIIKLHPALFKEIYHQRFVNNIYFDSENFSSYNDNINGCQFRIKYRIRWYGDLFGNIVNPILELKIKSGLVGRKESYPLKSFNLNSNFNIKTIKEFILSSELPDIILCKIINLMPVLLNRYARKYFISYDKKFRITLDNRFEYFQIKKHNNKFVNIFRQIENTVLEIKYDKHEETTVNNIVSKFPFRMTKNSKYVNGIELFYA